MCTRCTALFIKRFQEGLMHDDGSTAYKTVRGLSRGLLLLKLLNKFDGGATPGLLAEFSGLHRTTVRRLLETLQEEGFVRRSRSDDSFRLTINVRQLSDGFRDEHWISALATPLLGELLREVQWPTDITTLDVDAMVVRETTHRFSRLSFHRAMVGRRLPLLLTASGLTWLAFAPDAERDAVVSMLAARPEAEYQLAREPERLAAIRSDMGTDPADESRVPGNAFAADIAGYLEKYVILGNSECLWSFGFNVSNIGTKISYDGGEHNEFIPTTLRLGTGLLYPIDDYNRIGLYLDLSKYLVPSLPYLQEGYTDEEKAEYDKKKEDYNNVSGISGIFKSFGDSPDGFKGELQEVMVSIGAEYSYNEQFFLRGGYFYENANKGNRQYFSVGAGFRMSVFQLDAAYLVSTVQSNPLDQTLRFTLSFDMDGIKNLFR